MKIKYSDIALVRQKTLEEQDYTCSLCDHIIREGEDVLDHDHTTGYIRSVLHSDCNMLLGKIENFLNGRGKRIKYGSNRLVTFLDTVHSYITASYDGNLIHPKHKLPIDRQKSKYKRLIKASKKKETKDKYRKLLKELTKKEVDK